MLENGIYGVKIVTGIVTGIKFTEDKPIYELSNGKDKWQTSEITDNLEDVFKALKIVSLEKLKETVKLKIKFDQ